jgi:hypothetical protein
VLTVVVTTVVMEHGSPRDRHRAAGAVDGKYLSIDVNKLNSNRRDANVGSNIQSVRRGMLRELCALAAESRCACTVACARRARSLELDSHMHMHPLHLTLLGSGINTKVPMHAAWAGPSSVWAELLLLRYFIHLPCVKTVVL